jgi:hypothetical protein
MEIQPLGGVLGGRGACGADKRPTRNQRQEGSCRGELRAIMTTTEQSKSHILAPAMLRTCGGWGLARHGVTAKKQDCRSGVWEMDWARAHPLR